MTAIQFNGAGDDIAYQAGDAGTTPSGVNTVDHDTDFCALRWVKVGTGDDGANKTAFEFLNSSDAWRIRAFFNNSGVFDIRATDGSAVNATVAYDLTDHIGEWLLVGLSYNGTTKLLTGFVQSVEDASPTTVTRDCSSTDFVTCTGTLIGGAGAQSGFNGTGGRDGMLVVRNHQMTSGEFEAIAESGRYMTPFDYNPGSGNFSGVGGVQFSLLHAMFGWPNGGSNDDNQSAPGRDVAAANLVVFDRTRDTDMDTTYASQVTVTSAVSAPVYYDPYDDDEFSVGQTDNVVTGLPVSGRAPSLRSLANNSMTAARLFLCHANSQGTRTNADTYDSTDRPHSGCIAGGLARLLEEDGSGLPPLVGCVIPPRTGASGFVLPPWDYETGSDNEVTTGTVTAVDGNGNAYDDFSRLGTGNNATSGVGPGLLARLAASSSLQIAFDCPAGGGGRGDIDPDTDDIVVFAVMPKFPGGDVVNVAAYQTSNPNSAGSQVGSLTTAFDQDNERTTATVTTYAGGTTLVVDETGLSIAAGEFAFNAGGVGAAGGLSQASAAVEGGGDTSITLTHALTAASVGDTISIGTLDFEVVAHTIPAGTLTSSNVPCLRFSTGAGNAHGIISHIGMYAVKAGAVPGVAGHSGNGYADQESSAFLLADSSGYTPWQKFLSALFGQINGAYVVCPAWQNSSPSDMAYWINTATDAGQAGLTEVAYCGTQYGANVTAFPDADLTAWDEYARDNAGSLGVAVTGTQVAGSVVGNARDLLARGGWQNSAAHPTSWGMSQFWKQWITQAGNAGAWQAPQQGSHTSPTGIRGRSNLLPSSPRTNILP